MNLIPICIFFCNYDSVNFNIFTEKSQIDVAGSLKELKKGIGYVNQASGFSIIR